MDAPDCFRTQLLAALPRVRRYARSLVFDASMADDLAQSTVVRALSHWHQFDQRRDILVWLLSIAHNAFLDLRRRDARLTIADPADLQRMQDEGPHDEADRLARPCCWCASSSSATPRWPKSCACRWAP